MIRKTVLVLLIALLSLAAICTTALLIVRHPTPDTFRQATSEQPITLPCDEAAHFDVQSEWWYYTGFLDGKDGQHYAFELVFFKAYLPPQVRIGNVLPLSWVANPLYFAHLAVSDLAAQEHVFFERSNFPAFWVAGAEENRYEVWNGDWRAWGEWTPEDDPPTRSGGNEHHLRASGGRYALRLDLEPTKPPALHGPTGDGVVDMGQAGASYYYTYPAMEGEGVLQVAGQPQAVQATVWMDHQWGTWRVHGGYAGWDWFSLRLDDGVQVMLFDFRDPDGSIQPGSGGTWIAADGRTEHLTADDYSLDVLSHWTSPDSGATYPLEWRVTLPGYGLDVTVAATFPEQEMVTQLGPVYWEGAVTVEGTVNGVGFVEMTGYVGGGEQ